ncbi:MAG: hypothetical protein MPJ52_02300 [Alphaproteobacteria bacterium]|nr:hypothetical protein [Alphaproteobacteria bacterium]
MQPLSLSYPPSAVIADLARAVPGAGLCLLIAWAAFAQGLGWVGLGFLAVAALFVWLAAVALLRSRGERRLEEDGLRLSPDDLCRWSEIEEVHLRYWAGWRQRGRDESGRLRGMLVLRLTFSADNGGQKRRRRRFRFESSCLHFAALSRAAAAAAKHKGLRMDEPTMHNLHALAADSSAGRETD